MLPVLTFMNGLICPLARIYHNMASRTGYFTPLPFFPSSFDPFVKKRTGSKEKLEQSKLLHKMKREKKGAKKDIRADAAFIAEQRAKEAREK